MRTEGKKKGEEDIEFPFYLSPNELSLWTGGRSPEAETSNTSSCPRRRWFSLVHGRRLEVTECRRLTSVAPTSSDVRFTRTLSIGTAVTALLRFTANRIAIARLTMRESVMKIARGAPVALATAVTGTTRTDSRRGVALGRFRSLRMAITRSTSFDRIVIPRVGGARFAAPSLRQWRTDASARVRVANVSFFIARIAFWFIQFELKLNWIWIEKMIKKWEEILLHPSGDANP